MSEQMIPASAVRELVYSPAAERFRDEACRHRVKQPYADNRYVRLLDDLRALLDQHAETETAEGPPRCTRCGLTPLPTALGVACSSSDGQHDWPTPDPAEAEVEADK